MKLVSFSLVFVCPGAGGKRREVLTIPKSRPIVSPWLKPVGSVATRFLAGSPPQVADHFQLAANRCKGSHMASTALGQQALDSTPVVFVVDDDVSIRESLELLIQNEGWRPKMFPSAQEFLDYRCAPVPSCLILDISLPGLDGLELQKRVAAERIEIPIIFITGHGDIPKTVQAMKGGAVEFLTKPFNDEVLLTAIRRALERSRIALAHESELRQLRDRYASLTSRERQVMALVVSSLLNKQIGGELGISEITVKAHRGQVMQKMKAESVADLVKMAGRLQVTALP